MTGATFKTMETAMKNRIAAILAVLVSTTLLAANADPDSGKETRNTALARRVFEEGLNQGIFTVPYADDFVGHGAAGNFTHADGLAEAKGWRSAFPDLRMTVEQTVAEGNFVSLRWTARGTNTGAGNGLQPTGRRVEVSGMVMFRFESGKLAEEWPSGDNLGLMRQLGLLPAAKAANSR